MFTTLKTRVALLSDSATMARRWYGFDTARLDLRSLLVGYVFI